MGWRVTLGFGLVAAAAGAAYYLDLVPDDPTTYRTAEVRRGTIETVVAATGTVNAVVTTEVSSQLSGQVAELLVDFNDLVRKGQPLARLDPQSFDARVREATAELATAEADVLTNEAAVEKAEAERADALASRAVAEAEAVSARAEFAEAQRELNRRRALAKSAAVSQSDIEHAETRYKSTRAQLKAAEARLQVREAAILAADAEWKIARAKVARTRAVVEQKRAALEEASVDRARTEICSPLDGVVIRRDVDVGTTVAASLHAPTLFTIAQDLSEMKVKTKVDEADIGRIRVGQSVTFTVDAYPGRRFSGTVTQIRKAHELFQNVVTYTVIVSAANRDLALFPGMTAIVRITVEEVRDAVKVPNAALRFVPRGAEAPDLRLPKDSSEGSGLPGVVWVIKNGAGPEPVRVRIGAADSSFAAVLSGPIAPGDKVAVAEFKKPKRSFFALPSR